MPAALEADVVEEPRVSKLESHVADIRSDIVVLKTDVAVLKTDVVGLKIDVRDMRKDIAVLKDDVAKGNAALRVDMEKGFSAQEKALLKLENKLIETSKTDRIWMYTIAGGVLGIMAHAFNGWSWG